MITSAAYYATKTVAELRAILATDGIKVNSRTKKADLVTYVVNMLNDFHQVASDMDALRNYAVKAAPVATLPMDNGQRTQNYVNQNGSYKLTPKQNKRITKKGNAAFRKAVQLALSNA